jgi:hypothetical protein
VPNHIGLVNEHSSRGLRTIEFNTRLPNGGDQSLGGHIVTKSRSLADVLGFVKIY